MGRLSQTKYYLSNFSSKTTIIRRHHPLNGQKLVLLSVGKTTVVVRLRDGSSMKILRRWTDVDGVACTELVGNSVLSLGGLRELLSLFMALRERTSRQATIAGEMIATTQSNVEAGDDDEAETVGVPRASVSRGAVGAISRTSQRGGHAALRAVDGARGGGADSSVEKKRSDPGGGR
ncbi:MAG: hypothetical protein GY701_08945 [Sulfitobacter sp.]|nr:hypothetical protein [Sulfitobacter sp.]